MGSRKNRSKAGARTRGNGKEGLIPSGGMRKNITIVIIHWNTFELLRTCLESARAEGIAPKNVIVVDQKSHDRSAATIRRRFRGITVISNPNVGYGHAVNVGVSHVKTPFALVCNADTALHSGSLGELEAVFSTDPRVAMAGCKLVDGSGRNVTQFSRTSVVRGLLLEIIPDSVRGSWRDLEQRRNGGRREPFDVTHIEGSLFLVRTNAFLSVGGMDEGFSFFFEDSDLSLRFLKAGFRIVHVPTATATHTRGASFSQAPFFHAGAFYANMIRFYRRHALRRAKVLRIGLGLITAWKSFYFRLLGFSERAERNRIVRKSLSPNDLRVDARPLVSVIVPTVNRPRIVKRFLESLAKQTYRHFEVVVADQSREPLSGGTMVTRGISVKRLGLAVKNRALAKNVAARRAHGGILLFCDDDIIASNDFIEAHVVAHSDPAVGGVSCRVEEDGLPPTRSSNLCRTTFYGRSIPGYQSETTCFVETLVGANMSVKKEVWAEVGHFDPLFRGTAIFEEQDLSERIRSLGYRILFSNRTSVHHVPQTDGNLDTRKRHPAEYYRDFHHNEVVFFLKNRSRLLLVFVLPFCLLRSIKQSIIHRQGIRGVIRMFGGVPMGIASYYRSLH